MKTYKNLMEKIADRENVQKAILAASKGKKKRKDVIRVLDNIERYTDIVQNMLLRGTYEPSKNNVHKINEGTHHKIRFIRKPKFCYDQIIHHCLIQVLQPILLKPMYEYSCGSIPGRGAHYGKRKIEKWIRKDVKNTKYVYKMDIYHFYQSVNKEILKGILSRRIKDNRTIALINKIIDSCAKGLPLGNYTSQWFANYMLTPLDHYIKETLQVKYYIRYMDDLVLFGRNKKELHKAHKEIETYLRERLQLRIKDNWQVFRIEYNGRGRPLDFMGFQFYRNKTILRKSIYIRLCKRARKLKKNINQRSAHGFISYMGFIRNADCYGTYIKHIRPYVNIGKLKRFVSKTERRKYVYLQTHRGDTRNKAGAS